MNVYKYRSGSTHDIEALMNNQFFSASIESLNDIQEAKIKIDNEQFNVFDLLIKNKDARLEKAFKGIFEEFRDKTQKSGIYSLSKNYTNDLLWAHYSDSHKGFCIEYDLDLLCQYQLKNEFHCDVKYTNDIPIVKLEDMLKDNDKLLVKKLLATKSLAWKYEEEYRIMTGAVGLYRFYNRAVKSIYFGNRTPENTIKLIMSILRGRGICYYRMDHAKNAYALERVEIEDLYKDESIYKNKTNKYIPYLDDKTKPYEDLICKAITIVEQEPTCREVTDAYISQKGTKENPVFFITYKDSTRDDLPFNYFISKDEIEKIFS